MIQYALSKMSKYLLQHFITILDYCAPDLNKVTILCSEIYSHKIILSMTIPKRNLLNMYCSILV